MPSLQLHSCQWWGHYYYRLNVDQFRFNVLAPRQLSFTVFLDGLSLDPRLWVVSRSIRDSVSILITSLTRLYLHKNASIAFFFLIASCYGNLSFQWTIHWSKWIMLRFLCVKPLLFKKEIPYEKCSPFKTWNLFAKTSKKITKVFYD